MFKFVRVNQKKKNTGNSAILTEKKMCSTRRGGSIIKSFLLLFKHAHMYAPGINFKIIKYFYLETLQTFNSLQVYLRAGMYLS